MACSYQYGDGSPCSHKAAPWKEHDGKTWCLFHYPGPDDVPLRLQQLAAYVSGRRGNELDIRGFRVPGSLTVGRKQGHPRVDASDARIEGNLEILGACGTIQATHLEVVGGLSLGPSLEVRERADFAGSALGALSATQTKFHGPIILDSASVSGLANIEATFHAPASATGALFRDAVVIRNSVPHDRVTLNLQGARFERGLVIAAFTGVDLSGAQADDVVVVQLDKKYSITIDVRSSKVKGQLRLANLEVRSAEMNDETALASGLDLQRSTMQTELTVCAAPLGAIYSSRAEYLKGIRLAGCCAGDVDFSRATFMGHLIGEGYKVSGKADFSNAVLDDCRVNFERAEFAQTADFSWHDSPENGKIKAASFRDSQLTDASFDRRTFRQATDFRGCRFVTAPSFYNCELHPETTFPTSLDFFPDTGGMKAAKRYQTLKALSEELRSHLDEGVFNALQHRSLRHAGGLTWSEWFFSAAYDLGSVYGTSIGRPLQWLGLFALVFSSVFAWLESRMLCICRPDLDAWSGGVARSLRATLVPFYELRMAEPFWGIALLQSLIAVPLIAVFLLALRWRFKKD